MGRENKLTAVRRENSVDWARKVNGLSKEKKKQQRRTCRHRKEHVDYQKERE